MSKNLNKRPLFIFEMANNHQGKVEHGLRIIREFYKVSKSFPDFNFAFKLQARDIPTFIHPAYKKRMDIKYVKRFSETKLSKKDYKRLKKEIDKFGFISMCTPFDENSVDLIEELGFDIIKIGSPSFGDWPLLEKISQTKKPLIISVGGAPLEEIDKVVSFFEHREKKFSLMHCVSEYPTSLKNLQLNQIDLLKQRYPKIEIGYSTHEDPDNFDSIKIAIAKGATIFEKHIGVRTSEIELNAYSATPQQVEKWLLAAKKAIIACGVKGKRMKFGKKELEDLSRFKRGVFAKKDLKKGERLDLSNVFLAWPNEKNQILASDMSKYKIYHLKKKIKKNEPILFSDVKVKDNRDKVYEIMLKVREFLNRAKIYVPNKVEVEISHHYGIDKFYETGAVLINCINREYCKKIIVLLPGQKHPSHYHKRKEETFHILFGEMKVKLGNKEEIYKAGDLVVVERGKKHSFKSEKGVVFEEISTTHFKEDSFYDDKKIINNKERKTRLTYWLNF